MNRRYFFATVAAGLAMARMRAVAANEKVNVGMIGLGGRGRGLLGAYTKLPRRQRRHRVATGATGAGLRSVSGYS